MEISIKKQAFEYLLTQMLKWGSEMAPAVSALSFTRLKALKILFFTSAIQTETGSDLLDVFDNFYALPNGPVESDIYNCITSDRLDYYTFMNYSCSEKKQYDETVIDADLKSRIDQAIMALRRKNERIVTYSAEQLVQLSHTWLSWQNAIQTAKALGKGSYPMGVDNIRSNTQIYLL